MIGNAVPIEIAKVLGVQIFKDLSKIKSTKKEDYQKTSLVNNGTIVREKMNEMLNAISA